MPILNPLDLTHLLIFMTYAHWIASLKRSGHYSLIEPAIRPILIILSLVCFYWINAVLLRTMHHWFNIPFEFNAMFTDIRVQMTLSVYWTLIGAIIMIVANRVRSRFFWIAGASFLGLVLIKSILVDRHYLSTIEGGVALILIGLIFIVVAYFSPLPPTTKTLENKEQLS
jgi:uncharacterized membrane protein